jgi:hypothetical protein
MLFVSIGQITMKREVSVPRGKLAELEEIQRHLDVKETWFKVTNVSSLKTDRHVRDAEFTGNLQK